MTDSRSAALDYARKNRDRFVDELKEFVSIPSISTDPEAKADVQAAAEWVAQQLLALGMQQVKIYPTAGHPVVYGEYLSAGENRPIMLIYGHYDVQPVEPLELWETPPFSPTLKGENLYGRGASDMKGQVVASLKAVEALVHNGGVPVNLKFLVEGEEEIGSTNLSEFIEEHQDLLACDFALNPDAGMIGAQIPTITYGLRGLAYFELRLVGPGHDLHSGLYGGTIHNPAQVLCELIAGMHDDQGRVTLPGFYDRVRPISDEERKEFSRLPVDDSIYLEQSGAPALYGESGYSPAERVGARPTLEINGLLSGFTGEGTKTVLPSKAMAKISMRLVPDQDPKEVHQQLLAYLDAHVPPTVTFELLQHSSGYPSITDTSIPSVQAIAAAMEETWGSKPVFRREGGSVPVTAMFKDTLGVESILTGFGLPDDNLHAPNEKIHLPTFYLGIDTLIRFMINLGKSPV